MSTTPNDAASTPTPEPTATNGDRTYNPSLDLERFLREAQPQPLEIAGNTMMGHPKKFNSGSVGYNISGRHFLPITYPNGDKAQAEVQISFNAIFLGTKPKDETPLGGGERI